MNDPPGIFQDRVRKMADVLATAGLHALIAVSDPSVTYFTGFHHFKTTKFLGWGTVLIVTSDGRSTLGTPGLTLHYAEQHAIANLILRYEGTSGALVELIERAIDRSSKGGTRFRFGVESGWLPLRYYREIETAMPEAEVVDAGPLIMGLRSVKDISEIATLRRAASIADVGMHAAFQHLSEGVTELEVAAAATCAMLSAGADVICHCSVKSGRNSALIQSFSSRRRLEASDIVNIDLGAVVDGYCSDLTRTFVIGGPTARQRALFGLSLLALEAAERAAATPGQAGALVDAAARDFLGRAGYGGDFFPHLTGHGIGLDVHEAPLLAPRSSDILRPNMVICLEPGIYDLEIGGIRTEDMFLLTETGLEALTRFPRDTTWR